MKLLQLCIGIAFLVTGIVVGMGSYKLMKNNPDPVVFTTQSVTAPTEGFGTTCGADDAACLLAGCEAVKDISTSECQALVDLYTKTNGAQRTAKDNRTKTTTACSRYGVTCYQKHVYKLVLVRNNLSGPLPSTIGNLNNIVQLNLSNNNLSGPLPSTITNLSKAQRLRLNDNALTGPLPSTIDKLTSVKRLWLFNNQLSGPLPTTLGNLSTAQDILLSNNSFTGPIPSSLGKITGLKQLRLDGNQLNGRIPSGLGKLTSLQDLDLSHNQLCGALPNSYMYTRPGGIGYTYDRDSNKLTTTGDSPEMQARLTKNNIQFGFQDTQKCPFEQAEGTQVNELPSRGP